MKKNIINLYKHYCEMVENPKGKDSQERNIVKKLAINNKADLEKRFKEARKYKEDKEIIELLQGKPKPEVKEVKSGKTTKR